MINHQKTWVKKKQLLVDNSKNDNDINIGSATVELASDNKTWDGYGKVNPIPVVSDEAPMTREELVREKFKYLRRYFRRKE